MNLQAIELPKTHSGINDTCWASVSSDNAYDDALLLDILTNTRDKPICYANTATGAIRGSAVEMAGHVYCGAHIDGESPQLLNNATYLISNYQELSGVIKHNPLFKNGKGVSERDFVNSTFESCEQETRVDSSQSTSISVITVDSSPRKICLAVNDKEAGAEYIYFGISQQENGKSVCKETGGASYYNKVSGQDKKKESAEANCLVPRKIGEYLHSGCGWVLNSWGFALHHSNGVKRKSYIKGVSHYAEQDRKKKVICSDGKHTVAGSSAAYEGYGFDDEGNECWTYNPDEADQISPDECIR
ncbi:hypothetical protein EOPP23_07125 [Endozoicomonas sp. OPT23]|nr:hypothetical protein [Endozoicomonas sp. OPT23]